jgi:hypothetical protein
MSKRDRDRNEAANEGERVTQRIGNLSIEKSINESTAVQVNDSAQHFLHVGKTLTVTAHH